MTKPCKARKQLLEWMREQKVSQTQLAARVSVEQSSVHCWVTGKTRPSVFHRRLLEELTGISEEDWLTAKERGALKRLVEAA